MAYRTCGVPQGSLDYSKAQALSTASFSNKQSGTAVFNVNSKETYVFVAINTGGQSASGGTTSSTQIGYRFAAYDKSSTGDSFCWLHALQVSVQVPHTAFRSLQHLPILKFLKTFQPCILEVSLYASLLLKADLCISLLIKACV